MEVVGGNTLLPGDPRLIDHIVCELKSQGIFDQFRKECIADVDTKPAYQNLRQRVEGSVIGFLKTQTWRPDMNKNQLREMLRKNIYESGFLETGVERIVDQVVNPKINTVFLPQVEEVVYKFLGLAKPTRNSNYNPSNGPLAINTVDLLPTDLDPISPDFEVLDKSLNKPEKINEVEAANLDDSKNDEFESPPFEPITEQTVFEPHDESSNDSRISGISGLTSHESNISDGAIEKIDIFAPDVNNQDSQLSKVSSNSRLSIVTTDSKHTSEKMDISDDTQDSTCKIEQSVIITNVIADNCITSVKEETRDELEEMLMEINGHNQNKETILPTEIHEVVKTEIKEDVATMEIDLKTELSDNQELNVKEEVKEEEIVETVEPEKQETPKIEETIKSTENLKTEVKKSDRHRHDSEKRKDKHTDSKDRKDDKKSDKDRKDKDKYKSSNTVSSKDKDKYREKSKDSKSSKDKESKSRDDKDKKSKDDKDKNKSSSNSKHSSRDRNRSSSKSESKSSKDSRDHSKSSKDKSKNEDSKSKSDSKKEDESKSKKSDSSSKSRSRDHSKSESSKHSSSSSSKDRKPSSTSNNKDYRDKKDAKKSNKREPDDHSSSRDKKSDSRRSADRDSNDGSSGVNNSSNVTKEKDSSSSSNKSKSDRSDFSGSNSGDSGQSDNSQNIQESTITSPLKVDITLDEIALNPPPQNDDQNIVDAPVPQTQSNEINPDVAMQQMRLKKPKIASNIFEVRKLMKIRKRMEKLEKKRQRQQELATENQIALSPNIEVDSVDDTDSVDSESLINMPQNINEIVKNNAKITDENMIKDDSIAQNTSAIVSKESWDAIEAKLSQSAHENVDFNLYTEDTGDSSSNSKLDDSNSKTSKRLSEEEDCLYFSNEVSPTTERFLLTIETFKKNSILNSPIKNSEKLKRSRKTNLKQNVNDDIEITYNAETSIEIDTKKKNIKGKKRKMESVGGEKIDTENNNKKVNNTLNAVVELTDVMDSITSSPSGSNFSNGSIEIPTKVKSRAKKTRKNTPVNNSPSSEIDPENVIETRNPVKYARASIFKSQRYSSDDLYKPRPIVSGSSRRQRGLLNNTDKKN